MYVVLFRACAAFRSADYEELRARHDTVGRVLIAWFNKINAF